MRTKKVLNPERSRRAFTLIELPAVRKRAFTLIELLIVITIIAILATLIFVNVASARKKARDAKRKADLKNIQTALELFNEDNKGVYPATGGAWYGEPGCGLSTPSNGYIPDLAPSYVNKLPSDPVKVSSGHCYAYRSDGANYKLQTWQTVETPIDDNDQYKDTTATKTYTIYTPDAANWSH